jgi:hypothetical protein
MIEIQTNSKLSFYGSAINLFHSGFCQESFMVYGLSFRKMLPVQHFEE